MNMKKKEAHSSAKFYLDQKSRVFVIRVLAENALKDVPIDFLEESVDVVLQEFLKEYLKKHLNTTSLKIHRKIS